MAEVVEKMDKLAAYREMKKGTLLEVAIEKKQLIVHMHDIIAAGMLKNVTEMKTDLNSICSQLSSKVSLKFNIGKDFAKGEQYMEFVKSWNTYVEKYKSSRDDPGNEKKFIEFNASLANIIGNFENVTNNYIEKRTDLWFRYIDNASNVLTAAAVVQVGISAFTFGATAVTGGVTWCAKTAMKAFGKSVGRKAVKKALIAATKKKVAKSIASKIMDSNAMMLGVYPATFLYSGTIKGYAQNEMMRQGTGKAALSEMPILDKETKDRLVEEYKRLVGKNSSIEALRELELSVSTLTNPRGESTSEYLKSAAISLASSYIMVGIINRKKIAKLVMDKVNAAKKGAEVIPSGLVPKTVE
jgi:hypothetical protein